MTWSPNAALVRRTIDVNYDNKRRAHSLKWLAVNGVLVAVLAYDLWCTCPGGSVLHYVEGAAAALATAALLQHAWRLAPKRRRTLALTDHQRRLLGLQKQQLDSSFELVEERDSAGGSPRAGVAPEEDSALSVSLSPRAWRAGAGAGAAEEGPRAGAGHGPGPPSAGAGRGARDQFISDPAHLAAFLRECDAIARPAPDQPHESPLHPLHPPHHPLHPHHYHLAETSPQAGQDQDQDQEQGQGQGKPEEARSPQVWRRLQLDPRRLTQWNLNLRLWIHVTILERLVREMKSVDAELGLAELRLGQASLERLAKLTPAVPALAQLLPFLELAPDQTYLVQRIRDLARGGCLSEYRWCGGGGGGAGWEESKPTDAEVVLHLFATYLDGQVAGVGARPFSAAHVSAAPAAAAGPLGLHRARRRPPHYVLVLGADTLDVGGGRNNLLHTLLLFLAAAAREDPPALHRLHLGPAGLNLLWIIGR